MGRRPLKGSPPSIFRQASAMYDDKLQKFILLSDNGRSWRKAAVPNIGCVRCGRATRSQ